MIRFEQRFKFAYIAAVASLVGGALGFRAIISTFDVHLIKKPVPLRLALDSLPARIGSWEKIGDDAEYGAAAIESLGTDIVLTRRYQNDDTKTVLELHIAYYTGKIDSVPHVPERCWATSGLLATMAPAHFNLDVGTAWELDSNTVHQGSNEPYPVVQRSHPITGREQTIFMPLGEVVLRATEFQDAKRPQQRLVGGYFFIANGRLTPSAFGVRGLAFNRSDEYAYYCKVQLNFSGLAGESGDLLPTFLPIATEFFEALMPELMARLPEWPSVERSFKDPTT